MSLFPYLKNKIKALFKRIQTFRFKIDDKSFLILASILVGIIAGLAAVVLKASVNYIEDYLVTRSKGAYENYLLLAFPLIGILLTVIYVQVFRKGKITKGLGNIIYTVAKGSSDLPRHKTYSHMISSALTVGFGGSAGLEAPIVITGAAIGSNAAKALKLNYKGRTLLLASGSAAGISAIFNSPIAGVIFAFEALLPEFSVPSFVPLLIASATSAVVSNLLYSGQLFILVTEGWAMNAIPYYMLLGVLCGLVSAYIIKFTLKIEVFFSKMNKPYLKAVLGGLALGIIIFIFPPLYGEGYISIEELFAGRYHELLSGSFFYFYANNQWFMLAFIGAIILIKVFATSITVGAGGNGGIFAPSLFTGALTGFFLAALMKALGIADLNHANFIAVGMAGILSGVIHAPLTGIFLIAEVTGGYELFVPLMIVSAISFFTSRYLMGYSVYTKTLVEKGLWSPSDKDKNMLGQIAIKSSVETDFAVLHPNDKLRDALKAVAHSKRNIFPVVDNHNKLLGIIMLDDVRELMLESDSHDIILAYEVMKPPQGAIDIEADMYEAMNNFEKLKLWNLPVLENGKYAGFISKSTIFNKYRDLLI
ncbi:MAG TPA: chloride channel protein, partial [Ignavibacteriales bacterium]|nr:chloride channel protein [Ignavibacteriales bacterium]